LTQDNPLNILLRAKLNEQESLSKIKNQILEVQKELGKHPIEIKFKVDKQVLNILDNFTKEAKKFGIEIDKTNAKLMEQSALMQKGSGGKLDKRTQAWLGQPEGAPKTIISEWSEDIGRAIKQTEKLNKAGTEYEIKKTELIENGKKQREHVEKLISDQQKKNFEEAKSHLTQLSKVRTKYYELEDKTTNQAKQLREQMTYHQGQYNNIIRKKIDINEKDKIAGINAENLNQLEKQREQIDRNVSMAKSKNADKTIRDR
jgi:hypothetical protein